MAILLLLIACFNFTNTSIAISSRRLKEIGIRKVMGSSRQQLIMQFMGENIVLSFFAMIVSIGIAYFLVPAYSAMWDFIDLRLDLISDPEVFVFLFGLLIFTSLVAGAYPSIYISSYQPVKILRGNLSLGSTNLFAKILLTSQYTLTIIALISSLAFANNARYQESLDVGFERENIISVRIENKSEIEKFKNAVTQMPAISEVAETSHHIGRWTYSRTLRNGEEEIESGMVDFGLKYKDLMDLNILTGRYFEEDLYEHDRRNSLIVNQQMVKVFNWEQPLGEIIQLDDTTRLTVVGVMKNFHMWGFWEPISPLGIRLSDKDQMNFVVVKSAGNDLKETYNQIEAQWYEVAPSTPFSGRYMDEQLKESNLVNDNITTMFTFLGGVSINSILNRPLYPCFTKYH